jgi:hypothetical protein
MANSYDIIDHSFDVTPSPGRTRTGTSPSPTAPCVCIRSPTTCRAFPPQCAPISRRSVSMSEFTLPPNSKVGEGKHWAPTQPAEHV